MYFSPACTAKHSKQKVCKAFGDFFFLVELLWIYPEYWDFEGKKKAALFLTLCPGIKKGNQNFFFFFKRKKGKKYLSIINRYYFHAIVWFLLFNFYNEVAGKFLVSITLKMFTDFLSITLHVWHLSSVTYQLS